MHMLDPAALNETQIQNIKDAFSPLLEREILDVADELEEEDRQSFDDAVLQAFGLNVARETIYDSLLALLAIRQTATVEV